MYEEGLLGTYVTRVVIVSHFVQYGHTHMAPVWDWFIYVLFYIQYAN